MARSNNKALEKLINDGTQCDYVKWQAPVSPGLNTEPVYEFKLISGDKKYKVDQISKNGDSIYWRHNGIIGFTPWVNAVQSRPILAET